MGDHGGAGGAGAELHLKMSKKIAQLTKVIFHLNTRNEDYQMEFAHLKQVHALELQQLTHDAAGKLRQLTEQLANQKDLTSQAEQAAARDKQQWLRDLASFQQQAAAQQSVTEREFQRRIQMLEEQVEESRLAFVNRIQVLTQMAETQQRTSQSSALATTATLQTAHERAIAELKEKHADEITQVVMSSNAKYNEMLAEQLRLHDTLRGQLAAARIAWEEERRVETEQLRQATKQEIDESQQGFDDIKRQLVGKMEQLLADAETMRAQESKLRLEKEELIKSQTEQQRQLKLLELQLTKAQHDSQSIRKDADANTQKLQQTLVLTTEKVDGLTRELESMKKTLANRDSALQTAMKEKDALQLEILQGSVSLSERCAHFQQQLQERDLRVANLTAELQLQRQQASAGETQSKTKLQVLESNLAEQQNELLSLQQKLADLQQRLASADLAKSSLQKDRDKLMVEHRQKIDEMERAASALEKEHITQVEDLKIRSTEQLKLQNDAMEKRLADLEAQLQARSSASLELALGNARQEHAKELARIKSKFDTNEGKLRKEAEDLRDTLRNSDQQLAAKCKELLDAQSKSSELSIRLQKSEAQISRLEGEKAQLTSNSQKTQKDREDSFQKQMKELTALNESTIRRLTNEKDRLISDHKKAMSDVLKEHADIIVKIQKENDAKHSETIAEQNAEISSYYEQQLAELRSALQEMRRSAEISSVAAADRTREAVEARDMDFEQYLGRSMRMKERWDNERHKFEAQHRHQIELMAISHTNELDRVAFKLNADKTELLRRTCEQYDQRHANFVLEHRNEIDNILEQHVSTTRKLQQTLDAQRNTELLAVRTEMAQKLQELRRVKEQEQTLAILELTSTHNTDYSVLAKKSEMIEQSLLQRTRELEQSRQDGERLTGALEAKGRELIERVTHLERNNRDELERLKLAAKRDMDRLLEENLAETKALSEQFEETRRLMADKVVQLKQEITKWEERYARRESRPEDVRRIEDLERAVFEKDALVRQTLDEMAYFKRELLNREEMYNKTFARTPNVGVLNVLKPHVQMQAQLQQMPTHPTHPMGSLPGGSQQPPPPGGKRKTKPLASYAVAPETPSALERRGSERGTPAAVTAKKSLPPLLNNNQIT